MAKKTTATKAPSPNVRAKPKKRTATAVANSFAILRKKETNGDNYDVSTSDIIARLKKWQKLCTFHITSADYNLVKLKFDTLPKNLDAFVRDAYDLCPDLVQVDENIELKMLKAQLPRTKKMTLWWD